MVKSTNTDGKKCSKMKHFNLRMLLNIGIVFLLEFLLIFLSSFDWFERFIGTNNKSGLTFDLDLKLLFISQTIIFFITIIFIKLGAKTIGHKKKKDILLYYFISLIGVLTVALIMVYYAYFSFFSFLLTIFGYTIIAFLLSITHKKARHK